MFYDIKKSGERIRQLRKKSGFTQEKTAIILNINRSFYNRIEVGKSGCSIDLFIQLSELFHVSLDYLILGKHSDIDVEQVKKDITQLIAQLDQIKSSL